MINTGPARLRSARSLLGVRAIHRWGIVALSGLVLGLVVWVWPVLPIGAGASRANDSISGAEVLARIVAAGNRPYSGYVETTGTLALPVASRFTDVGELLGETTLTRVWWRDASDWRVNKLLAAGETDLIHRGEQTTEWSYESAEATVYRDPDIRLPRTSDLLPPALGARAAVDADRDDVQRIEDRVVAGRWALGVRLRPVSTSASIDHVDVWADEASGHALRLEVYVAGAAVPSFTSEFREFSAQRPAAAATAFSAPASAKLSFDDVLDIADAANQFSEATPPARLGGLAQAEQTRGAVGVYGSGMTQLVAIPLWERAAEPFRDQLRTSTAVQYLPEGTALTIGPLAVLLTEYDDGSGWLLAGTVTQETLRIAAPRLPPVAHDHD